VSAAEETEVPPWHPWCGCYGCRAGAAVVRKLERRLSNTSKPREGSR
jgi:hypothetical protein